MISDMLDRLRQIGPTLVPILIDPTSNPKVALLLYSTIAVLLLLVLVIGLMVVMSGPEDDAAAEAAKVKRAPVRARASAGRATGLRTGRWLIVGIPVLLVCMWLATGFTTSTQGLCESCHSPATTHATASGVADPHAAVDCVACHETGGLLGRYITNVPARLLHLAVAAPGAEKDGRYGMATSRTCSACHSAALAGSRTNAARGLKMSHAEVLSASARCIDCHTMRNGVVSTYNAGMKQCLRCHDGKKASAECTTCHVKQPSEAARARTASFQTSQIREVSCAGCHNEKASCDPCHGLRMPHTTDFMTGSHARAATVDFWYNGGKECARCHTATRHPCTRCHTSLIGHAHGASSSLPVAHRRARASSCSSCHQRFAPYSTRDFCKDVCHSAAAIAASPR